MSAVQENITEHAGGPSLASRLGVSVDKLDFEYVASCKDTKELEKILKVLRSGEEGTFQDLERKTEEQLQRLNPKSRMLRKEEQVLKSADLRPEDSSAVADDLSSWLNDVIQKDQQLKLKPEASEQQRYSKDLPPIRNSSTTFVKTSEKKDNFKVASNKPPSQKTQKPRDYREWDKIISTLDKEADVPEPAAAPNTTSASALKPSTPSSLKDTVNCAGLTNVEMEKLSQQEKEKGNEALKSESFAEAVTYYSRSISACPTIAAHNNRALAYIKMGKWSEATSDCDYVLKHQERDVKALLRRATAFKGQQRYAAAKSDIDLVLAIESNNRQASELLASISEHLTDEVSQKNAGVPRRLVIEETDGEDSDTEGSSACNNTKKAGDADTKSSADLTNGPELHTRVHSTTHASPDLPTTPHLTDQAGVATFLAPASSSAASIDRSVLPSAVSVKNVSINPPPLVHAAQEAEPTAVTPVEEPVVITVSPLPSTVSSLSSNGGALFKAGQYGDAKTFYDQAIKELYESCNTDGGSMNPYNYHLSSLYSNRAACHFKTGEPRSCVTDCTTALELVPHAPKPLMRRAQAYEQLEKYGEAYADYRHYLARTAIGDGASDAASAQQGASRCQSYLQQQHGQKWRDRIPKIPSVTNLPIYEFDASNNELSRKSSSETPSNHGQHERQQLLNRTSVAGSVKKDVTTASAQQSYESVKNEGNMFFKKGNYQEAVRCYTLGIELSPDQDACYANRAECYLRLGQAQQAAVDASKAVLYAPDNVKALYRHARACKMLGQFNESRELYEKVLRLDKNNKEAQKELELVKAAQIKVPQAQEAKSVQAPSVDRKGDQKYEPIVSHRLKIIETSSDESDTETMESSTGDSSSKASQVRSGGLPSPVSESRSAAEVMPPAGDGPQHKSSREVGQECAEPPNKSDLDEVCLARDQVSAEMSYEQLKEKGRQLVTESNFQKALDVYSEGLARFGTDAVLHTNRALCHLRLGQYTDAVADCNTALDYDPKNLKALYRLGLAEKYLKNYKESLRALKSVCQYDKSNKDALREQSVVKELYRQQLDELKSQSKKQPSCNMGLQSSSIGNSTDSSNSNNLKSKATKMGPSSGVQTGITAGSQSSSSVQGHKTALVTDQTQSFCALAGAVDHDRDTCDSCPMSHRKHNGDTDVILPNSGKLPGHRSNASETTRALSGDHKSTLANQTSTQSTSDVPCTNGSNHAYVSAARKPSKVTSTSFMQEWHRVKSQRGTQLYADLLRKIAPDDIPEAVTNQIDGDMLSKIVLTLKEHFTSSAEDLKTACKILKNISRVSRFNMAKGFLSHSDKNAIQGMVKACLQNGVGDFTVELRAVYGI